MATVISILALVVSVIAVFHVRARANWIAGALETHSQIRLRMEAAEKGLRVIWWDRTRHGKPPRECEHNTTADLAGVIYLMVPLRMRAPFWWQIWRRQPYRRWIDRVMRRLRQWVDSWCEDEAAI